MCQNFSENEIKHFYDGDRKNDKWEISTKPSALARKIILVGLSRRNFINYEYFKIWLIDGAQRKWLIHN